MMITSKLKNITLRLVSCILVMAIALQFIVMPVSASGDASYKCTSKVTLPSLGEHDFEDAMELIKKMGITPFWGYFHNQVQDHIVNKYNKIHKNKFRKELKIIYKPDQEKEDNTGRADIAMDKGDLTYLWEVKPVHYGLNPKLEQEALEVQLRGYVESNDDYRFGHESGVVFEKDTFPSQEGLFTITYEDAGNGLILYRYDPIEKRTDDEERQLIRTTKARAARVVAGRGYEHIRNQSKRKGDGDGNAPSGDNDLSYDENGNIVDKKGNVILPAATISAAVVIAGTIITIHKKAENKTSHSKPLVEMSEEIVQVIIIKDPRLTVTKVTSFIIMADAAGFSISGFADAASEAFEEDDPEAFDELIEGIQDEYGEYERAGKATPPRDPLVIDLGTPGIELHSIANGVNFDLDNNGFAEKTAWIGGEDGFLALDRNGNGMIDNGGELFGDQVIMKNGSISASGFEALAELDSNRDGVIDAKDSRFSELLVWIDADHNGISDEDELNTLSELGVISISLDHTEVSFVDEETGSRIAETSTVTIIKDGIETAVEISEFWLPVNSSDTTQGGVVTAGNVPDLMQAINDDESGMLFALCYNFSISDDITYKRYLLKRILYFITDAEDIPADSRGGNIDARDLRVIERFMGSEFDGVGGADPNSAAAVILKSILNNIENQYFCVLNMYSALGGYLHAVYVQEDEDGSESLNMAFLDYIFDEKISEGENMDSLIYDLGIYLKSFDSANGTNHYEEYAQHYSAVSDHFARVVELTETASTYIGTELAEKFNGGDKNEFIFGEGGNDVIRGGNGSDVLDGGEGDDTLYGDMGDDTYIFGRGYGKDLILDNKGNNRIIFRELLPEDMTAFYPNGGNNAVLTIDETGDQLTIQNFCANQSYRNFTLEFADGTMISVEDELSPFLNIAGSDSDETLQAFFGNSVINGLGGKDILRGSAGNDRLYGGSGNDTLYSYARDDVLDGGEGDDTLYGDMGDDTYIFGRGYGNDLIMDYKGNNRIIFPELLPEDITSFYPTGGNNAVLTIDETGDQLTIQNFCANQSYRNFTLEFADGTMISVEDELSPFLNIAGSDSDETLQAFFGNSVINGLGGKDILRGSAGNDRLYGGSGNDTLYSYARDDVLDGGEGDDTLYGDMGDDTYIFGRGYGNDLIMDYKGNNRIIFPELLPEDITSFYPTGGNNAVLTIAETGEKLTIQNFCADQSYRNFTLEFADGTMIGVEDERSPFLNIAGSDSNETLQAFFGNSTINGFGGKDILRGSAGNDKLYGGSGNDTLYSYAGDDVLDGGEGDDTLYGDSGDDTYIYGKGYGNDLILDKQGNNKVKFPDLSPEDMTAFYPTGGDNAVLIIIETGEKLTLQNFRSDQIYRNFTLEFADGTVMDVDDERSPFLNVMGSN